MKKKTLSIDEVKHIAKLANLGLDPKAIDNYQKNLSEILEFVDQLKKMETKNVLPTSQVTEITNVFREDEIKLSLTQTEALSNAQRTYKGYFVVKAVFG